MRALVVMLFVVACDHRPSTEPSTRPVAPAVRATDAQGLVLVPGDDVCMKAAVNIADVIIAATTDPTQKAAYEQERTKMVKRFSTNCEREPWSDTARACFLAAKTQQDIDACSRAMAPPPPQDSGVTRD